MPVLALEGGSFRMDNIICTQRCGHAQIAYHRQSGMLRPRGLCGLEAKLFGLGLVVSDLGLGLVAYGLGLIEVGLVASKFAAYMD